MLAAHRALSGCFFKADLESVPPRNAFPAYRVQKKVRCWEMEAKPFNTDAVVTIRELVAYIVKTDVPSSRETENRIVENVPYRPLTARNRSGNGFEH